MLRVSPFKIGFGYKQDESSQPRCVVISTMTLLDLVSKSLTPSKTNTKRTSRGHPPRAARLSPYAQAKVAKRTKDNATSSFDRQNGPEGREIRPHLAHVTSRSSRSEHDHGLKLDKVCELHKQCQGCCCTKSYPMSGDAYRACSRSHLQQM